MRNLKRALSLALASVMLLGMMVVGTSAKGLEDFGDAAEITNADAVAVTSEIGIFKGYDDGEFKPAASVTRAQMAVIIAKMLYGADVKADQFAEIDTFTDVPAWAEGYVNLVASLGIVAGRGNGIFDPNATVTTAEAAMMLTKALGYFQNAKDFGSDWMLAATAKATELGLYGDLKLSAKAPLNRENVAVMTFNALTKAVPVQYNELLGVYYNENQGIIYSLEFNYLETLGYKNFDLVYKTGDETVYGRPATTWGFGSYTADKTATASGSKTELTANGGLIANKVRMLSTDEIITIAETPDVVYTDAVKNKDLYKELGATVCDKYDWTVFVNGAEVDDNDAAPYKNQPGDFAYAAKGAQTEIYIDEDASEVIVVVINNYLGEISKVKADYVVVKDLSNIALDDNTFATDAFAEDELVVFTVDYNNDEEFYICEMYAPTVATGEVVRVEKNDKSLADENNNTYIKLDDGSKNPYSVHNVYDLDDTTANVHPTLNTEYNLYLDANGYVLGFEEAEETVAKYLYVKDSDEEMGDWRAKVLLSDGTTKSVDVKTEVKKLAADGKAADIAWIDSDNNGIVDKAYSNIDYKVFTYTVNADGVYTLTAVPFEKAGEPITTDLKETDVQIHNGKAYFTEGEDDVIVDKKTTFVDDVNDTAYTGYDEVPNVENAQMVYVKDGLVVEIAFILYGDIYDADATYFVLTDTDRESLKYDDEFYWDYSKAYIDGEKSNVIVSYDNGALRKGVIYKAVKTIDESYITEVEEVAYLNADGSIEALAEGDIAGGIVALGDDAFWVTTFENKTKTVKFDADEETQYILVEQKFEADGDITWTVSEGDIKDLEKPENDSKYNYTLAVDVVEKDDEYADVVYIYVTETEKGAKAPAVNADGSVTVDVQKGQNDGDKLSIALSAPEVDGKDIASWEGKDAVITIEVVVDGDVYTKVTKVAGTNDVTDILAAAVTPAVAVAPTGTHKVVVSATVAFDGMNNDSYVLSGTSNVLYW